MHQPVCQAGQQQQQEKNNKKKHTNGEAKSQKARGPYLDASSNN